MTFPLGQHLVTSNIKEPTDNVDNLAAIRAIASEKQAPPKERRPAMKLTRPAKGPTTLDKFSVDLKSREGFDPEYVLGLLKDQTDINVMKRKEMMSDLERRQLLHLNAAKEQIDLRPLAAFVDSMTGSNIASTYSSPKAFKENMSKVEALENAIAAQDQAIMKDKKDAVVTELNARIASDKNRINQEIQALKLMAGIDKAGRQSLGKAPPELMKKLGSYNKSIKAAESLIANIESNKESMGFHTKIANPSVFQFMPGKMGEYVRKRQALKSELMGFVKSAARAVEGGRMSDYDTRYFEEQIGNIEKHPEVVLANIRRMLSSSRSLYNDEINLWQSGGYFVPSTKQPTTTSGGKGPGKSYKSMSAEERKAYFNKLKGAK